MYCAKVPHGNARVIRWAQPARPPPLARCHRVGRVVLRRVLCVSCSLHATSSPCCAHTHTYPACCAPRPPLPPASSDTPPLARSPRFAPSCLQENKSKKDFGESCRQEVASYEHRASKDYRLNYRLRTACKADMSELCKDACAQDDEVRRRARPCFFFLGRGTRPAAPCYGPHSACMQALRWRRSRRRQRRACTPGRAPLPPGAGAGVRRHRAALPD